MLVERICVLSQAIDDDRLDSRYALSLVRLISKFSIIKLREAGAVLKKLHFAFVVVNFCAFDAIFHFF